jgi:hemerythrin-like domain-containing protein
MKATEVLIEEHRVIKRVLACLEAAADRLEAGQDVRPEFFIDVAGFVKGYADGCHHAKEEGVLFPAMAEAGVLVESGPIGVMLMEHELGREYARSMREAARRLQAGDETARPDLIASSRKYASLLSGHIYKEDNVLFPMAGYAIPADRQEKIWEDFDYVEHEETGEGVHEKYLGLAEALEAEVRSWSLATPA